MRIVHGFGIFDFWKVDLLDFIVCTLAILLNGFLYYCRYVQDCLAKVCFRPGKLSMLCNLHWAKLRRLYVLCTTTSYVSKSNHNTYLKHSYIIKQLNLWHHRLDLQVLAIKTQKPSCHHHFYRFFGRNHSFKNSIFFSLKFLPQNRW